MVSENGGVEVRYALDGDRMMRYENGFAHNQFDVATLPGTIAAMEALTADLQKTWEATQASPLGFIIVEFDHLKMMEALCAAMTRLIKPAPATR